MRGMWTRNIGHQSGAVFHFRNCLYRGNLSFILNSVKRKVKLKASERNARSIPTPPVRPWKATEGTAAARCAEQDASIPTPQGRLGSDVERVIADGLRKQTPIKNLPGITIENVCVQQEPRFDIAFEIRSGSQRIPVFAEVKPDFSPRRLAEIAPWIQRLKSLRDDVSIAVAAPSLSPQSQAFCIENGIDFFDLAGNIFISVPGRFTIQRTGMRDRSVEPATLAIPVMNVFSGRASRVLRVLLEKPGEWSIKGIGDELTRESERLTKEVPEWQLKLSISMGTVSKAVASLEEQLWIRRLGAKIVVPEPARLLRQWAEKYKERYRWRLRDAVQVSNPFGANSSTIAGALSSSLAVPFATTGATAVADVAPWVEVDVIDLFTPQAIPNLKAIARRMNNLDGEGSVDGIGIGAGSGVGCGIGNGRGNRDRTACLPLRLVTSYDPGVFMYCRRDDAALEVSLVQAYLDLYARGGRDSKQADYLLERAIEPRWSAT